MYQGRNLNEHEGSGGIRAQFKIGCGYNGSGDIASRRHPSGTTPAQRNHQRYIGERCWPSD